MEHFLSVAICTYNGGQYIEEQLNSILSQDVPVDEIVIGDDGSKDDTLDIAKRVLKNSGVRWSVIQNETNLGYRKNFENVIAHTKGDLIFLCDQDDVWVQGKVGRILREFDADCNCLMVFSNGFVTDSDLNVQKGSLWDDFYLSENIDSFRDSWEMLLNGYYITGATACIRRELFEKSIPFSSIWVHDGWLGIHAAMYGTVRAIPEKLIYYRQHGTNQIGDKGEKTLQEKIKKKMEILRKGAEGQLRIHREDRDRWVEFYRKYKDTLPPEKKKQVRGATVMFTQLSRLPAMSAAESIKMILSFYKKGYYKMYCKHEKGVMLGDLLFLSVLHKDKNRDL